MGDAAVDRVPEASLSLVTYGDHRIEAFVDGDMAEQLGNIAGSEDLVHRRKVGCTLLRIEIRREYAPHHALSSQKLASPARPTTSTGSGSGAAAAAPTAAAAAASTAAAGVCTHLNYCFWGAVFGLLVFFHIIRVCRKEETEEMEKRKETGPGRRRKKRTGKEEVGLGFGEGDIGIGI